MPFYKASLSNVASMNVASMIVAGFLIAASFAFANPGYAQTIKSFQKISDLQGGFAQAGGMLEKNDDFGEQVDNIGDVDGDGVNDLVVGVNFDDDGGENRGAVYILFMNTNGTVKALQKISSTQGGFTETGGVLDDFDSFSRGATGLGDLDNDGVPDIAVGAPNDDDTGPFGGGSSNNGAVYILFLNTDGTVKSQQKISEEQGGLNRNVFRMGGDLEMLGDIDGDGVEDLFVQNSGGFYLLFLNTDGTVKSSSDLFSQSGSGGFGQTGALIGDLDGDGVMDIATGAQFDDDGGNNQGAVWILFMNSDATERQRVKISATQGGFTGLLEPLDEFGQSVSPIGDHNGDGIPDLLVGAEHADSPDGTLPKTGEAWILHLNRDGTVLSHELMRSGSENFTTLEAQADFGQAVTYLGDLDGDGIGDIVVASDGDRDCNVCGGNKGTMTGAVYVLFLQGEPGNRQPELTNIPNETVVESDLLTINIMATDDDMDPLILTASELTDKDGMPVMGAMFTDFTDGTGSFSWTPGMGAAALSPYTVTFTATEDTMDALFDSQPVTIFVNDGSGGGPPVTYEFESLTVAASDGTTTSAIKSNASASEGQYFLYNSNAVGEFVTFAVPITSPGANVFDIQYHLNRYRGTFMVEVAETLGGAYTQIGVMNTTVNSGSSFPALTTMPATFTSAGTKYVRFTATGSNPNTGSERIGLDKIDVIPQGGGGGNVAPVLADISNPSVTELDPVMIPVMATDDDMDPLILTASELTDKDGMPVMGAMFTDFTDGTGSFSWTPGMGAALLSPYTVTFTATEDTMAGKSDMLIVTIFVNDGSGGGPPVTYEFESLTMAASDGTTTSAIKTKSGASNGQYFLYNSNAVGEFVTFPINVSAPGAYDLDLQYHLARYRGTFMVEVAETLGGAYTQIGVMNTTVNSGSSFPTLSMTATFASAGTKYVRFTATGSNPNTGSERIGLDKVDVTPQ